MPRVTQLVCGMRAKGLCMPFQRFDQSWQIDTASKQFVATRALLSARKTRCNTKMHAKGFIELAVMWMDSSSASGNCGLASM